MSPGDQVTLVTADAALKGVDNLVDLSARLQSFEVVQLDGLPYPNLSTVRAAAVGLDTTSKKVLLDNNTVVEYDRLCICSGATPKRVAVGEQVIAVRDQHTVQELVSLLGNARKLLLVGNGGIALELVHALQGVDIVWAIKHNHIGDAYFDSDAASFLFTELDQIPQGTPKEPPEERAPPGSMLDANGAHKDTRSRKLHRTSSSSFCQRTGRPSMMLGSAVGPHWSDKLSGNGDARGHLQVEWACGLEGLVSPSNDDQEQGWPVHAKLTNGSVHGVDVVVSAIGVTPNVAWVGDALAISDRDGGLVVDGNMCTSAPDVYAAGDACTATYLETSSPHWFQMRLWTQARVMGMYAAHCMLGVAHEHASSFNFELFTHVTRFCGKKVVLLGLYNGQRLEEEPDADITTYSRSTEGLDSTFVRVLLLRGRMQGAVLIGDTSLEETYENLILGQLDISSFGPSILDPDMEVDHIFD